MKKEQAQLKSNENKHLIKNAFVRTLDQKNVIVSDVEYMTETNSLSDYQVFISFYETENPVNTLTENLDYFLSNYFKA